MLKDFNAVRISVASPQDILNWSHGEVTKAETINYRTFRSEPGGLMAEEIFGPTKDFECYCGKYKKIRYKGIVCDRCGVEVTHKRVRRERMGHLKLAAPVTHVWFANGVPNKLSLILDIPQKKLETVVYYARYVVTGVNEAEQKTALESLKDLKISELKEIDEQEKEKIQENAEEFALKIEDIKKETKDSAKQSLQLERLKNQENQEVARIKSACNQKRDNADKKFADLKSLIADIKQGSTLSEEEYQMLEDYNFFFFDAGMGAEAMKILLEKLNITEEIALLEETFKTSKSQLKKSRITQRLRVLKGIAKSGMNPSWLVLDVLPVIPPDLRPIIQLPGGRFATYDLNDLYRRVINRNNRLKRLINLGAPEIILRNEKRMLQEAVDSLLDNNHKPGAPALNTRQMPFKSLSDMLRGKQGRFRQNLLGKRVDYSGRAVIIAGPELTFNQCGLPKNIAVELFKPFIIRDLIERGEAANPNRAKMIFEAREDIVWDILEDVIKDRPVLLNRAPSLHRYSILAFYPVLIEGNAIRLHPMVCKGFNADFDGDQMAVHLPLSDKSVEEVKSRMFVKDNMIALRDGTPIVNVEKDMAMGVYFLTIMRGDEKDVKFVFENTEALLSAYHRGQIKSYEPVKLLMDGEIVVTTYGRILFNRIMPKGFGFLNKPLAKSDISQISSQIFRTYGNEQAVYTLNEIKNLGFIYAMKLGVSVSMQEFRFGARDIRESKLKEYEDSEQQLINDFYDGLITENELNRLRTDTWFKTSDQIQEEVWALAKTSTEKAAQNLIEIDSSGGVPVSSWVKQISGVRGSVSNMDGHIVSLPLKGNFEMGLNNFEYFVAAKAVRKSFADVALKTSESGYLTRRLVDVSQDIITKIDDCGTHEGLMVKRSEKRQASFEKRLRGRVLVNDVVHPKTGEIIGKRNQEIDLELAKTLSETEEIQEVGVRSALTCKVSHGICQLCYGWDNGTGKLVKIGEAVGIIAAQALGEPTTQLTLKSKSDARANKSDVTQGLPRVQELIEARTPKALAELAQFDGKVSIIEDKKRIVIRVTAKKKVSKKIKLEETDEVIVKDGAKVKSKDVIIVRKDKSEVRADSAGVIKIKDGEVILTAEKELEVERYTDVMSNLLVQDGEMVVKGQQLTFGSLDPKEVAALRGIQAAQEYIISGVQDVYGIQGLEVDDRHLEIIARQMGRYGLITHGGNSDRFLPGDYADALDIDVESHKLIAEGKEGVKYDRILLGVTNASIRTESFLSAASFEQQVRVLTDAALIGKVDHLRGLKENVIIGRPVPLGEELVGNNKEEVDEAYAKSKILVDMENSSKQ